MYMQWWKLKVFKYYYADYIGLDAVSIKMCNS